MTEHDYDNCVNKMKEAIDYTYEEKENKVTSWSSTLTDTHYPSEKLTKNSLDGKQATLVSGTNIKTINNESLLGSGNITVGGGSSVDIVTSWEQVLSDTKVPSEKLTKETIDTKISKSQTAGLVKNDGTINTDLNTLVEIIEFLNTNSRVLFDYSGTNGIVTLFNDILKYDLATEKIHYGSDELATLNDIPSLTNYIQKSQTAGLVKNDGTIDTTSYISSLPSASTSTQGIVQLVDNLTTNDDTKALTAKQGKALYDLIDGVEEDMLL